jgi:uncharacterized protein (DUF2267 family)
MPQPAAVALQPTPPPGAVGWLVWPPAGGILSCVDHQQLLQSVELMAGLDRAGAQRAVTATLATLAERLGRPAAVQLAGGLPPALRGPLAAGPAAAESFDAAEFARRTASRDGVAPAQGRLRARAVLATLREDIAAVQALRDQLPPDYQQLFG